MAKRHRRQKGTNGAPAREITPDFQAVLALPERLASYLRLWLQCTPAEWTFCLDKLRQGPERAYARHFISKGRGKARRPILAPCAELKCIQRAIVHRILSQIPVHFCRHGVPPGSSVLTNARQHLGADPRGFSVDLVNAYPTVRRSRIRANLRKPFRFGLRQFAGVAFSDDDAKQLLEALVDLVCLRDRLPQGPPTSPRLLAICCMKLDQELWKLCAEASTPLQTYRLTIWMDDITISADAPIPPQFQERVLAVIRDNGFIPHTRPDKTKYFSPETGERLVVTGLVVNPDGRLTLAPRKVDQIRARLHHLTGLKRWDEKTLGQVMGLRGHVRQIYPKRLPSDLRVLIETIERRVAADRAAKAEKLLAAAPPAPAPADGTPARRRAKAAPQGRRRPHTKEELPLGSSDSPF